MHRINKATLFNYITEQHVDDITFLWLLRSQAVTHPQHTHTSVKKLEHRINMHLKGLAVTPDSAWTLSLQAAEFQKGGEAFTLAMLAFDCADTHKINAALDLGMENPATFKGLLSALGWLPADKVNPWLQPWIESQNPTYRHLSIAACSVRRIDPHAHLTTLFDDPQSREHLPLYCRMLRLIGELKRQDLAPVLAQAQKHEDPAVVFWACWSAVLLGDHQALQTLAPYLFQDGPLQATAIATAFRHPHNPHTWEWLNTLASTPGQIRAAIKALAALGEPHGMNWLLTQMEIPEYAKLAGEAFSTFTGVDLEQAQLTDKRHPGLDNLGSAEDDDNQEPEDEQDLPVPHTEKIRAYWRSLRPQFIPGQRYFLGQPVTESWLKHIFLQGQPRHRLAAALEFTLLSPTHAYPNAKAPRHQENTA